MSDPRRKGFCAERAGFLFSHDCPRIAAKQCSACGKAICQDHTVVDAQSLVCTTCAKKSRREDDTENQEDQVHEQRHSPFFYHSYYSGWGSYGRGQWGHSHYHDPHDFTEADGESLMAASEEDFAHDMSGS